MAQKVVDIDSLSRSDIRAIALRELNRRAKISAAKRGVPKTAEERAKIGAGRREYYRKVRAGQVERAKQALALSGLGELSGADAVDLVKVHQTLERLVTKYRVRDGQAPGSGE